MPPLDIGDCGVVQPRPPLIREAAHTLPASQASHPDVLGQGPDLKWELLTVLGFSNGPVVRNYLGRVQCVTCKGEKMLKQRLQKRLLFLLK